jgi:hypothetical protein
MFGSYFIFLAVVLFNKSGGSDFSEFIRDHTWKPLSGILLFLFAFASGLYLLFAALAGPVFFTLGATLRRLRVVASNVIMALLHFVGNPLYFNKNQWTFVHFFMCGQLIAVGLALPASRVANWVAFGLLVFALVDRVGVRTWVVFDYVWGVYFVILAVITSFAQLSSEVE